MKKWLTLLLAGSLLAACQTQAPTEEEAVETTEETQETAGTQTNEDQELATDGSEERQESQAVIDIEAFGEEVASEEVVFEEPAILMDVMEENLELVATDDGFIESIQGYEQNPDNNAYWMYQVNEEMAPVGANEFELRDGDRVEWVLEPLDDSETDESSNDQENNADPADTGSAH